MSDDTRIGGPDHRFPTTHWSAVLAARSGDEQDRLRALDALLPVYWKPVYKYIRLRWSRTNEDAKDLTQEFLARLVEKGYLDSYDPARARLRTFLRVCVDRFISNQDQAAQRQKRGGDFASVDFDAAEAELMRASVERQKDWDSFLNCEWARSVFEVALERCRKSCSASGRELHCRLFERRDLGDEQPSYNDLAHEFGLKVTDVTNFLASARREFRAIVLDTLREMTASEEEFRRECRDLLWCGGTVTGLSDQAVARLREAVATPDLSGTRYRLVDRLGQGGMSTVFLVEDVELHRKVALKLMDVPELSNDVTDRLLREARILAQLEHPGIVPVHDVGRLADGRVFYTMKYVEGRRLDEEIERIASVGERLRLFERICETVAFAHARGVLHRDLKPANIMVGPFGEVLVLDWGVAKFVAREDISDQSGSVVGTPGYMAPEQERGEIDKVDQRTDVYALGIILRRLVSDVDNGSVPRPLKGICDMATAPLPEHRYASARELAADITRYLDGLSVSAYPEPWWEKTWRWLYRNRIWIMLVLTYLLARMVILFFYRN